MNTELVLQSIEKLADKLGTTAEKIYGYYLKEAKLRIYYWAVNIGISLIFLAATIICGVIFYDKAKIDDWSTGYTVYLVVDCICICISFLFFIVEVSELESVIRSKKNPEYMATQDLLSDLTNN